VNVRLFQLCDGRFQIEAEAQLDGRLDRDGNGNGGADGTIITTFSSARNAPRWHRWWLIWHRDRYPLPHAGTKSLTLSGDRRCNEDRRDIGILTPIPEGESYGS
jgi:hypothetical protein